MPFQILFLSSLLLPFRLIQNFQPYFYISSWEILITNDFTNFHASFKNWYMIFLFLRSISSDLLSHSFQIEFGWTELSEKKNNSTTPLSGIWQKIFNPDVYPGCKLACRIEPTFVSLMSGIQWMRPKFFSIFNFLSDFYGADRRQVKALGKYYNSRFYLLLFNSCWAWLKHSLSYIP